ncbi:phage tail protein [Phytobacter ursingii]|uniref:Phage tail protein n=1 Tax=Phytobacter ursingii TaxID=1972431 RepID=A0AB35RSQ2_9ENTR|nr:phage tail protein [Phytobacter ursingii]MDV2864960.1 phage tail protein [Phytobacter ursingii]
MTTPNPLAPVKGAGTTLWIYTGSGTPNPLVDTDWARLAQVKELTPGELTADSFDETYIDDPNADWTATAQGQKSAGDTSFTLAWKPGEQGQISLVQWFEDGLNLTYRIKYPNGTVDVFYGWVSSLGKAVTNKEYITRSVKITNRGKPVLAENASNPVIAATGALFDKSTAAVAVGATTTLNLSVLPSSATDKSFRLASSDPAKATVSAAGSVITVTGVAAGTAEIIAITSDGAFAAISKITVS